MARDHDTETPDTLLDPASDTSSAATLAELPKDSEIPNVELDDSLLRAPGFGERYALEHVLGQGGMGAVYLYRDRQIGRRVALKVLHENQRSKRDASLRFVREARVQGQLEHPSVVPVYDLGVDPDGSPFFTMKRVRGVTLEEIIDALRDAPEEVERSYSRRRLLTAFSNVCLAVDFAHRHGVLHRDLKPANVMLGHFGEVYVLDWGLAKVMGGRVVTDTEIELPEAEGRTTMPGVLMGTPGYMAPEQLRSEHEELGPQADVYALGAILFELLTCTELHPRETMAGVVSSTLSEVEARPSARAPERDVAPELEAVIVRATRKSPDDRYSSAREMSEAIERYLDGERDQERRQQLAAEHAQQAVEAAARSADPEHAVEERRNAMRAIGRSLALDPANELAMQTLVDMLTEPPPRLPPEVEIELDSAERAQVRWVGRIGGIAFLIVLLYLPLAFWAGIESWLPVTLMTLGTLGASVLSFATWMTKRPKPAVMLVVMLLSNVAFASTAALWGPLIVTPTLLAINTASFALYLKRNHRRIAVATGAAFMIGVVALGLLGALPAEYAFEGGNFVLRSDAIRLSATPTLALWTTIAVGAVGIGAAVMTRMRDSLSDAERQLYLYAWHLREFVPPSARPPSDPTGARRAR